MSPDKNETDTQVNNYSHNSKISFKAERQEV